MPNTYWAKVGMSASSLQNGLKYAGRYLHWYMLWPFFLAGGLAIILRRTRRVGRAPSAGNRAAASHGGGPATDLVPVIVTAAAWWLYVVAIGGDFMEFRMLIPAAPMVAVALAFLLHDGLGALARAPIPVAAVSSAVLLLVSVHHGRTFVKITADQTLDSVRMLGNFYDVYKGRQWSWLGGALRRELADERVLLAARAVGAIPYYSRIPTVDMYGLNDRWVAKKGATAPSRYARPGHQRQATLSYLRRRGVNFVIGHPTVVRPGALLQPQMRGALRAWAAGAISFNREPTGPVTLVSLPVDSEASLLLWYLTPTPELDAVISARGWETLTLAGGQ